MRTALIWFIGYGLPFLGIAGLIAMPLLRLWLSISWWWITLPVALLGLWVLLMIYVLSKVC
jgi:hypothetical protein